MKYEETTALVGLGGLVALGFTRTKPPFRYAFPVIGAIAAYYLLNDWRRKPKYSRNIESSAELLMEETIKFTPTTGTLPSFSEIMKDAKPGRSRTNPFADKPSDKNRGGPRLTFIIDDE